MWCLIDTVVKLCKLSQKWSKYEENCDGSEMAQKRKAKLMNPRKKTF